MKKDRIEELYSELESFSKTPPEELWDAIEERLQPEKKKKTMIFFWGSAAAIIVLLVGYIFTNSIELNNESLKEVTGVKQPKLNDSINKSNQQTIIIVEGVDTANTNKDSLVEGSSMIKEILNKGATRKGLTDINEILNNVTNQKQLSNGHKIVKQKVERKNDYFEKNIHVKDENLKYNKSYSQNIVKERDDKVNNKDITALNRKDKIITNHDKEKLVANNDSITKVKDLSLLELSEKLLAKNETISDSSITNIVTNLKWSVEVLGGLANTASEATIQDTSVSTTSQNDFVYILKVGYAISDRLVVKSGIGKNILGQEINNIKYTGTDASFFNNNSQSIVNNQNIIFLVSEESLNDISTSTDIPNDGNLEQQFDYVQVPLEFSYSLLKAQKFDVSIGGGGNINFLINNRAFLDSEQIGESLGANSTIIGATMNTNISFNLTKKAILFLEPSYNYFEKPIDNNNQTFNNTQLRVLFGLRYKF